MVERIVILRGSYSDGWILIPCLRVSFQKPKYIYVSFLKWYLTIILTSKKKAYDPNENNIPF